MDEIELLVAETFAHYHEHFQAKAQVQEFPVISSPESMELPSGPGIIYHIQKSQSIFVIRTFLSTNVAHDYKVILDRPEDFPSLRLLEGGDRELVSKLRFFLVENQFQAEIIHDHLNNRRFPIHEELLCNLSDPGFSWWLSPKGQGFQLSFTMSSVESHTIKLGPLGDQQLALKNFQLLESILTSAGLELSMQNEMNRVQFAEGEEFLMEELKDLFQFGTIGESLVDLFKMLARNTHQHSLLESSWFYLQEVAAMRRFWIQVQYDLNVE
jgi:hypothetical protein